MLYGRRRNKPHLGIGIDRSYPLSQGLLQYWAFNEGSVRSARDLASDYAVATIGPTPPTVASGIDGPCLSFSSSQFCYISTTASVSPPKWTLAVRLKINASHNYQSILVSSGGTFGLYINNLTPDMYFGSDHPASRSLTPGVWSTLIVTYNGSIVSYFLDGKPAGTFGWGNGAWSSIASMIGSNSFQDNLDGSISWLAMWGRVLSPAEIGSVTANPWQCCTPPTPRFFHASPPPPISGDMAATARHATSSASASSAVPAYAGSCTIAANRSVSVAGASSVPVYAGSAAVARHAMSSASASSAVPLYAGSCTVAAHRSISATAATSVPIYAGSAAMVASASAAAGAEGVIPTYAGSMSSSVSASFATSGAGGIPTYAGSASLAVYPRLRADARVGAPIFEGGASLVAVPAIAGGSGVNTYVVMVYEVGLQVVTRYASTMPV